MCVCFRWYHGALTRSEAECLLTLCKECSYLVRKSQTSRNDYSLSLRYSLRHKLTVLGVLYNPEIIQEHDLQSLMFWFSYKFLLQFRVMLLLLFSERFGLVQSLSTKWHLCRNKATKELGGVLVCWECPLNRQLLFCAVYCDCFQMYNNWSTRPTFTFVSWNRPSL